MPADMDDAAKAVWRVVVRDMPAGLILTVDGYLLRCFAEAVSRYEVAARLLARSAPIIRGARHGDIVRNPLVAIVRDAADQVRLLGRELGLSPAARAGLSMPISPYVRSIAAEIGLPPRYRIVAQVAGHD